tara:strand:- start:112 stop:375 length:264 start_codon:yes stop_codon:yes gene_type:complete
MKNGMLESFKNTHKEAMKAAQTKGCYQPGTVAMFAMHQVLEKLAMPCDVVHLGRVLGVSEKNFSFERGRDGAVKIVMLEHKARVRDR